MAAPSSSSIVVPDGMHIYQNRLATFSKALSRRRASNVAGKSSHSPLIWPHTSPSTEKLAKAGFYYRPTISAPDNACCYLCKKNLDGWEPDDVPAIEHAKHSLSCGWAIVHATEIRLQSSSKAAIEDPMSEGMVEARRMTFGKWWPHEKKKGWDPKVNKLAEAGFHYAPTTDSDDFVQCAYCELGLDGWEPEDDPLEEHKRRQSDCKFFTWKKPRTGRASSVGPSTTTIREHASVDPEALQYHEEDQDSDVSIAESTISTTTRGLRMATTSIARGRKHPAAAAAPNRRKPRGGAKNYDSEAESIPGSPPPTHIAPEPRVRAPRGRKRTSSALGANRVSLFDASDFVEEQFAKPAAPAPAKGLRQSKRSRVSTANNAVVDEDREMHYESDASVATNATSAGRGGPSKRKRGTTAEKGVKAISRYQIPGDEEIDRALELDLERELSDDGDITRYIKPFIKTPKRRLTRNKMVKEIQAEGQPPAIGGATIASKSTAKKFTPAGMRNYFANQDLDYSLPISIPRHLAVRGEIREFEHMEEDTPIKEKSSRGVKKVVEKATVPEPEPMQEEDEEIVIVSEKITKKGGRGRVAKFTAKELAAAERTTAAAVVAASQATRAQAPPPAKRTGGARPIQTTPIPEAREPSPARLRNIRKSIDGGIVLFDGGATSSENESDSPVPQPPWEPTPEEEGPEPKPTLKGRKGGKKAAATPLPPPPPPPPPAKGKRGKAARTPTPEPEPETKLLEEPVPEEVMEEEIPSTSPPAPAKGKEGRKAPVSKRAAAAADTSIASAASAPRSPSPALVLISEAADKRASRGRARDSGARLSAAENVVHQNLGLVEHENMLPPLEPKGKRTTAKEQEHEGKGESTASNRSARSGGVPPYVSSKSTVNYDDVLARSFAKKPAEPRVVAVVNDDDKEEEEVVVVVKEGEVDPVKQQLAIETGVAELRSLETREKEKEKEKERPRKGGKGRLWRKGRKVDKERESESQEEEGYDEGVAETIVVKPAGKGRGKKQEQEKEKGKEQEQGKEDSDSEEVAVTRRHSNRFRRSLPKYADPSSSSEGEMEEVRDEGDEVEVIEIDEEDGEDGTSHGEDGGGEEEVEEHEAEAEYQGEDLNEPEEEGESESDLLDPGKSFRTTTTSSPKKSSLVKERTDPRRSPFTTTTITTVEAVAGKSSLSSSKHLSSPAKSRRESKRSMRTSESQSFAQTIPEGRGRYAEDTTATEDEGDEKNEEDAEDEDDGETTPQPADDSDSASEEREEEEEEVEPLSPPKPVDVEALNTKQKKKKICKATPPKSRYTPRRLPFSPMKATVTSLSSSSTTHSDPHSHSLSHSHSLLPLPIPTTRGSSSEAEGSHTSRLESIQRWTPTDPDDVAPLGDMDLDLNLLGEGEAGGDGGDLLTLEEKSMTVQEWVRRRAEVAEERFRDRCEGMIGRLMEEGRRAVRAIEGIRGGKGGKRG